MATEHAHEHEHEETLSWQKAGEVIELLFRKRDHTVGLQHLSSLERGGQGHLLLGEIKTRRAAAIKDARGDTDKFWINYWAIRAALTVARKGKADKGVASLLMRIIEEAWPYGRSKSGPATELAHISSIRVDFVALAGDGRYGPLIAAQLKGYVANRAVKCPFSGSGQQVHPDADAIVWCLAWFGKGVFRILDARPTSAAAIDFTMNVLEKLECEHWEEGDFYALFNLCQLLPLFPAVGVMLERQSRICKLFDCEAGRRVLALHMGAEQRRVGLCLISFVIAMHLPLLETNDLLDEAYVFLRPEDSQRSIAFTFALFVRDVRANAAKGGKGYWTFSLK